ncbi:MAG: PHB depolymerase family esterase [Vulcanimicrobiaceae bacterium]
MIDVPYRNMIEATRLVRANRLAEATTLLRRALDSGTAASTTTSMTSGGIAAAFAKYASRIDNRPPNQKADPLRKFLDLLDTTRSGPRRRDRTKPPAAHVDSAPDGARFIAQTYHSESGSMNFKLYVPSGYSGQPLPLIVMLHGCMQSPDDFAAGTRMNALAEEGPFLVAYPAQAASANPLKCWNWFDPSHQQRDCGEPALIAGVTRQIVNDYAVDPQRVYIAGLSAGAASAAVLGTTYPDLYAAIGVHSGVPVGVACNVLSALTAMRNGGVVGEHRNTEKRVPMIVFHGDRDATVHPANSNNFIAQAMIPDVSVSVHEGKVTGGHAYSWTRYSDASGRSMLEQWIIHGAGHAWSGGSPSGSFTDQRGPDASREMVRFFLAQANCQSATPAVSSDASVHEGLYFNRTDFVRPAIRGRLERHPNVTKQSVVRKNRDVGLRDYSHSDLEAVRAAGQTLHIQVLGLARIAPDVSPELARAAIASVRVLGALQASAAVKAALADRIE